VTVLADSEQEDGDFGFGKRVDSAADLEAWRHGLLPGVPVHVCGLQSRPSLNGCAGFLMEWFPDKERWAVQLGQETLLLRTMNIVP